MIADKVTSTLAARLAPLLSACGSVLLLGSAALAAPVIQVIPTHANFTSQIQVGIPIGYNPAPGNDNNFPAEIESAAITNPGADFVEVQRSTEFPGGRVEHDLASASYSLSGGMYSFDSTLDSFGSLGGKGASSALVFTVSEDASFTLTGLYRADATDSELLDVDVSLIYLDATGTPLEYLGGLSLPYLSDEPAVLSGAFSAQGSLVAGRTYVVLSTLGGSDNPSGDLQFTLALSALPDGGSVPEPASLALLGVGGAALASRSVRRPDRTRGAR